MKLLWFWCLLALCTEGLLPPTLKRKHEHESERHLKLHEIAKKAPNHVINVDAKFLRDYVMTPYRDYHLLVLLSVQDAQCSYCSALKDLLLQWGNDIWNRAQGSSKMLGVMRLPDGLPLYVGELDAREQRRFSDIMQLQSVPDWFYLSPKNLECRDASGSITPPDSPKVDTCKVVPDTTGPASRLRKAGRILTAKQLDQQIWQVLDPSKVQPPPRKMAKVLKYGVPAVLLITAAGTYWFEAIQNLLVSRPKIIGCIALLSCSLSCSGVINTILNEKIWFGQDKDGKITWVAPGGYRRQYGAEGVIRGFTNTGVSLSILSVLVLMKHKPKNRTQRFLVPVGIVAASWCCLTLHGSLMQAFRNKKMNFQASFWPSSDMIRGSYRNDRMYSI